MSLATSYTSANKFTSRKLQIRYRVVQNRTSDSFYYEVFRYATKSYAYLGMTEAAAEACQAAKIAQYTRTTRQWTLEEDGEGTRFVATETRECMASITATPNGPGWDVSIDVDETDVVLAFSPPADPESLFTSINARSYDEDSSSDAIQLLGANKTSASGNVAVSVAFAQSIPGFDGNDLGCEFADSPSSAFVAMLRASSGGYVFTTSAEVGSPFYVRLKYGQYVSNVMEVV